VRGARRIRLQTRVQPSSIRDQRVATRLVFTTRGSVMHREGVRADTLIATRRRRLTSVRKVLRWTARIQGQPLPRRTSVKQVSAYLD
jgi:hypothetical protein